MSISHHHASMKTALAENNLLSALKHCSNSLNELRATQLPPKEYYELYVAVFDQMQYLAEHLSAQATRKAAKGKTTFLADLYEMVQYSGNIVPRLYMMIVVGTTYMAQEGAPVKEIMRDLIEMCRGVQHPIRGLFLRYYLSQRTKELLPLGSWADFSETVEFLLTNFVEMNKLWVRLQHQGHSSQREMRTNERRELKILVGSNLVRLSQVIDDYEAKDYSPVAYYAQHVFPQVTEQIIQCRDLLAQTYLVDVLIQIFPDEFHFATLDALLGIFDKLHPDLQRSSLVAKLVERFISYGRERRKDEKETNVEKEKEKEKKTEKEREKEAENEKEKETENEKEKETENDQEKGKDNENEDSDKNESNENNENENVDEREVTQLLDGVKLEQNEEKDGVKQEEQVLPDGGLPDGGQPDGLPAVPESSAPLFSSFWSYYTQTTHSPSEQSLILQSLIQLTLAYDHDYSNIDTIYGFARELPEDHHWMDLLMAPIEHFPSPKLLFSLDNFYGLYVRASQPHKVALALVDKLLASGEAISSPEEADMVFKYLDPLVTEKCLLDTSKDLGVVPVIETSSGILTESFLSTQTKICQVIRLARTGHPLKDMSLLMHMRKHFLHKAPHNIVHTYPTLVSAVLDRLHRLGLYFRISRPAQGDLLVANSIRSLSVIIGELYEHHPEHAERVLHLYLDAAGVADQLRQQQLSYELFNQCFVVYEECLVVGKMSRIDPHDSAAGGSRAYMAVLAIANKLYTIKNFSKENYEQLITKLTLYGSKLLKKQDQCRAVYLCAHLWYWCEFFPGEKDEEPLVRDFKRVLECLQKALRVADSCMDPYLSLKLFVEILNRCLVFNVPDAEGSEVIDARYVNGLIELIRVNVESLGGEGEARNAEGYFRRTLMYVGEEQGGGEFGGIEI